VLEASLGCREKSHLKKTVKLPLTSDPYFLRSTASCMSFSIFSCSHLFRMEVCDIQ
jgi:hypothetical protein